MESGRCNSPERRRLKSPGTRRRPSPPGKADSAGLDGGQSTANAGKAGVAGKLEKVEPDTLIIRDGSGFEYWLKASDNTQITYNGKRARLTDFKQGADVRASFVWQGNQRVATEVEVLDAGQPLDGGRPADAGI